MNIFNRFSNGWTIALNSFKVLQANKQLLLFPLLSSFSLLLVSISFVMGILAEAGWQVNALRRYTPLTQYSLLFLFYFINYFVVVFFNVALMHCTRLYFKGQEVNLRDGLNYSVSRVWAILSWALLAATVGTLLRLLQENMGRIGKMLIGIIGIVWNVATFFVVPIIAYEKGNAFQAFGRSANMMKEKWGEKVGASFSFGMIMLLGILLVGSITVAVAAVTNWFVGIMLAVLGFSFVLVVLNTVRSIFISAVYHQVAGDPIAHHFEQKLESLFIKK